jgi:hypothetical protein
MMTNKMSTESFTKTPRALFDEPMGMEADAAAWAGLLDEWLGPDNDVYGRLLDRPGYSDRASRR